ncbi:MAG: glycosyltransferase [Candidatus Eisenbacteria bacterium]
MHAHRRILVFAYFFPPYGGAGVQRIVKFAKYLPDEGWEPTIVTGRGSDYWMADASLAAELGPRVRVVRTSAPTGLTALRRIAPRSAGHGRSLRSSVGAIHRWRGLSGWLFVPDSYIGWLPFAARAGSRLLARERFDWILTTSSPDSAHLIGLHLSARHRIPWLADFRDPWTRRLSFHPPTAWHRRRHEALERQVLRRAALVTFTSEETRADYQRRFPELPAEKFAVITNGFDEEDFRSLASGPPSAERFQILHAGQLNPERAARPFLLGLRRFLDDVPRARARLEARLIGPAYERDRADIERLGLSGNIRLEPACRHAEIVRAMRESHLLLLMEHESERGGLILPGKIFEYLRAGRPILGLVPRGAAWNLIERLGAGRCCLPGDAEGCAALLAGYFSAFERGDPEGGACPEDLGMFERRALTHRLAGFLAAAPGEGR